MSKTIVPAQPSAKLDLRHVDSWELQRSQHGFGLGEGPNEGTIAFNGEVFDQTFNTNRRSGCTDEVFTTWRKAATRTTRTSVPDNWKQGIFSVVERWMFTRAESSQEDIQQLGWQFVTRGKWKFLRNFGAIATQAWSAARVYPTDGLPNCPTGR